MKNCKYVSKWVGKILHIYDWTYRQNYYYIPAKTHKEYWDICKKQLKCDVSSKKKETGGGFNVFEQNKTEVCFIWAKEKRDIVHECFHAIDYTLRSRGVVLDDNSTEAYAYALGFLVDEILKNLSKTPPTPKEVR
jgi:hypothetical protein